MKFWLAIGGQSVGPYTVEEIGGMLQQHHVTRDTPAMPEDGEEWQPLARVPELAALPVPPPPPPGRRIPGVAPHAAVGGAATGPAHRTTATKQGPITVAQPSSTVPILVIIGVLVVLAGGGGVYVHQHSRKLKQEAALAEAKADEQRRAAEAEAREAAERAANPALALRGASREQIIAALEKEAGAIVSERPMVVNLSTTPTKDADIAMARQLDDLEVLHLGGGEITDEGLGALAGLKKLRELSIGVVVKNGDGSSTRADAPDSARLKVTDAVLEELKDLKGLRKLYLWNCGITDAGLETLGRMQGLYDLELVNTPVSEAAARRFIEENPRIAVTVRSPGFELEP